MIDPSHGGEDHGTILSGKVQEKDLTLALARELRRQLEERGIHARLLRDADTNLSLERRAEVTNQEHAGIYVAFHAGPPGKGVRVYSTLFASVAPAVMQGFLPWDAAQATLLERSRMVAHAVSDELRKTDLPVSQLIAPLRPLNNVAIPAISVEWAPGPGDLKPQENAKLSVKLASAVASGIAQMHPPTGPHP